MLEWRGIGYEGDMRLGRRLVEQIHVVVGRESWECIGAYGSPIERTILASASASRRRFRF